MRRIIKIFKIVKIIIVTIFFLYTIALLIALFYTSKAAGFVCLLFVLGIVYLYIQLKNRVKRAFTRSYTPELPDNTPKPFNNALVMPNVVDEMTGEEFELFCATVLLYNGFKEVSTTPITNDYGADLVDAEKIGFRDDFIYHFINSIFNCLSFKNFIISSTVLYIENITDKF